MTPVKPFFKAIYTVSTPPNSLRGGGVRRGCQMILGCRKIEGSKGGWIFKKVDTAGHRLEGVFGQNFDGECIVGGLSKIVVPHMDVSLNGGKTPKWMMKIMENPYSNGWFGGYPLFLANTHTQKKRPIPHGLGFILRCSGTQVSLSEN